MVQGAELAAGSGPVTATERIQTVDVLRGFALLGILVINIEFFALPGAVYFDPPAAGGFTGLNLITWWFATLLFRHKMIAIFSMLFGAGAVLMWERAQATNRPLAGTYYRRTLWLLVIGLLHIYLVWYGDVLHTYAVVGLLLFFFRKRSPRFLIILAVIILAFGSLMRLGAGIQFSMLKAEAERTHTAQAAGEEVEDYQLQMTEIWEQTKPTFEADPEEMAAEIESYRGLYGANMSVRVPKATMMITQALPFMTLWRVAGTMLLGMALLKLGVFSNRRSTRFYATLAVLGYVVGLPMVIFNASSLIARDFDFIYRFLIADHFDYWGSIFVALAHVGLLMLVYRAGWFAGLMRRLAAVGRMAFTNYLMHSFICTFIFYGFGLGLFARFERFWLIWFVLGIWILQLWLSPWWLKRFRFGPAEWLWRSLTYARRQPMRVTVT